MRAAFGQRLDEVKRRRIGPMQILEGEHDRLVLAPGQKQGDDRDKLPPPRLSSGPNFGAVPRQRNIEQRAHKRRRFLHVELHWASVVFEVGEPPFGSQRPGRRSEPGPTPQLDARAYSAAAATSSINPGMRRLTELGRWNSSHESGLSEPGLTDDLDKLALAGAHAVQRRNNVRMSSSRPTKDVIVRMPASAAAAGANNYDKATGAGRRPSNRARPSPRQRRARPPGAARFP